MQSNRATATPPGHRRVGLVVHERTWFHDLVIRIRVQVAVGESRFRCWKFLNSGQFHADDRHAQF